MHKYKLGEMLLQENLITPVQLEKAIAEQKTANKRLGHVLIDLGYISEDNLLKTLGKQLDTPYVNLNDVVVESEVINLISEDICRRYKVVPYLVEGNTVFIAMIDPLDFRVINDIKFLIHKEIKPMLASEKALTKAISKYYGLTDEMRDMVKELDSDLLDKAPVEETENEGRRDEEAPIIKIVDLLIINAVKEKSTDIHIEPFEKNMRVRYRKDGILHEVPAPPFALYSAMISRVKIMALLDIAETRLPQDGRISKKILGRDVDFRVSIVPNQFGERIVLRVLDRGTTVLDLEKLGMQGEDLTKFLDAINKPYGMILISGPTGSGKTTTLYAALTKIYSTEYNIMTIEDPIEYSFFGIGQVEVKEEIGLNFAKVLRSFLRHDPDIILLGEMRDFETADIAVRAALTGHLVFSTIHTNDAPSSVTRLIDMGIEPFLINSCIVMVMSQRLVRKSCEHCREQYIMKADQQLSALGVVVNKAGAKFYKNSGCEICGGSGYKGRIAIFEIMVMDPELKTLIAKRAEPYELKDAAMKNGMRTLFQAGLDQALKGMTTVDELIKVAGTAD
ncbi:MAG: ATPase, T2SS/T4P/T4SS family [Candidatus Firestonebacteria bacterium]|nr:ATPase, T2SS/T4P/T4SS family [Candidatus Firestonebacteria bacterium]